MAQQLLKMAGGTWAGLPQSAVPLPALLEAELELALEVELELEEPEPEPELPVVVLVQPGSPGLLEQQESQLA